jgi:hypothetical protein
MVLLEQQHSLTVLEEDLVEMVALEVEAEEHRE